MIAKAVMQNEINQGNECKQRGGPGPNFQGTPRFRGYSEVMKRKDKQRIDKWMTNEILKRENEDSVVF